MKPKEYEIRTLKDMVKATNHKNIDGFLNDLKNMIILMWIAEKHQEIKDEEYTFTFVDDGKNEIILKDINHIKQYFK